MRYIKLPDSIKLVDSNNVEGDASLTWQDWMLNRVLQDETIARSYKGLCLAADLKTRIKDMNGVLVVGDLEWDFVKQLLETPSAPLHTHFALQLLPFMKAWMNASEEKLES